MNTPQEIAQWQTQNVCFWLDNDEPSYNAYIDRLERRGLFTCAADVREFVYHLWGDRTPGNESMGRVHWGEVMAFANAGNEEWIAMRISEIKRHNKRAGHHWFDRDTLAFFNGIVYPNTRLAKDDTGLTVGILFVSSERCWIANAPRLYSVRMYRHDNHQIDTVGVFQGYLTLGRALHAMRSFRPGDNPPPECDSSALNAGVGFSDEITLTLAEIDARYLSAAQGL